MFLIVHARFQLGEQLREGVYTRVRIHGTVSVSDVITHVYLGYSADR